MDLTGLGSVAQLGSEIVNRIWPDASESDKAKLTLALAELQAMSETAQAQAAVNRAEAESGSWVARNWRPSLGWICVFAFFYQFVLYPPLLWITAFFPEVHPPVLESMDVLMQLISGLLGISLAGLRSFEKAKGVARN